MLQTADGGLLDRGLAIQLGGLAPDLGQARTDLAFLGRAILFQAWHAQLQCRHVRLADLGLGGRLLQFLSRGGMYGYKSPSPHHRGFGSNGLGLGRRDPRLGLLDRHPAGLGFGAKPLLFGEHLTVQGLAAGAKRLAMLEFFFDGPPFGFAIEYGQHVARRHLVADPQLRLGDFSGHHGRDDVSGGLDLQAGRCRDLVDGHSGQHQPNDPACQERDHQQPG